jgi:hypothetical protein
MYYIADQLSNLGQYQKALEAFQEVFGKRRVIDSYSYSKLEVKRGKQADRIREEGRKEERGRPRKRMPGTLFLRRVSRLCGCEAVKILVTECLAQ